MNDESIASGDCDTGLSVDRDPGPGVATNGQTHAEPGFLSPALLGPSKTVPAYEMKFVIGPDVAEQVRAWAPLHLTLDPHADAALGGCYQIRSLYFDTERFDVFHRAPSYRRRKFRLRRYGSQPSIFLERKTKSGDRVSKRRTVIAPEEIRRLLDPASDPVWPGSWFHRKLLARQLQPRCLVHYRRIAYVGATAEGPVRLTLDRDVRCLPTDGWDLHMTDDGLPLLTDQVVLELKYLAAMPALFKGLIGDLRLNPGKASKYRLGIQALGLAKEPG